MAVGLGAYLVGLGASVLCDSRLDFLGHSCAPFPGHSVCVCVCVGGGCCTWANGIGRQPLATFVWLEPRLVLPVLQMNSLAEADARNMDLRPPRPAIEKLKALDEVCRTLRQRKYRDSFLAVKGLNAFAA